MIKQVCIQVGTLTAIGGLLFAVYIIAVEVPEHIYRAYINCGVGIIIGLLLADGIKFHRAKKGCDKQN